MSLGSLRSFVVGKLPSRCHAVVGASAVSAAALAGIWYLKHNADQQAAGKLAKETAMKARQADEEYARKKEAAMKAQEARSKDEAAMKTQRAGEEARKKEAN